MGTDSGRSRGGGRCRLPGAGRHEVLALLSWQLDGQSGENLAAEDGLLIRGRLPGGTGRLGAHGAGGEPPSRSVLAGKVRPGTTTPAPLPPQAGFRGRGEPSASSGRLGFASISGRDPSISSSPLL